MLADEYRKQGIDPCVIRFTEEAQKRNDEFEAMKKVVDAAIEIADSFGDGSYYKKFVLAVREYKEAL